MPRHNEAEIIFDGGQTDVKQSGLGRKEMGDTFLGLLTERVAGRWIPEKHCVKLKVSTSTVWQSGKAIWQRRLTEWKQ